MQASQWWAGTRLVASRSLIEGARSRTIRLTTLVLVLVGLAAVYLPRMLGADEDPTYTLATVDAVTGPVRAQIDASAKDAEFDVEYTQVPDDGAVEAAVRSGDATVGLVEGTMFVRTDAPGAFPVLVAQAIVADESSGMLQEAGLTPAQVAALGSITPPERVEVGPVEDEGRAALGFLVGIVLYLALMFSGNIIATNVAVEKSTRIAEVLLAVLRPSQILVGNVLGIGLQTLILLVIPARVVLGALAVTDGVDVPRSPRGT